MEKDARDKTLKANRNSFTTFAKQTDETRLSNFFECIANAFDPHTDFFAPEERKNFDIGISGQLEGIGAQLQDKSGNITIDRVIPGSPAWKSGEIKDGDVIVKVAQDTGEAVDIQGMLLEKAIQLIRGKKGTVVRLSIRKPDGSVKQVVLIRDVIHLEEKYAHDAVIDEDGKKMGYIRLPEFYTDFDRTGSRTCAADVKQLLQELNAEHVQGIIMDLRDNGGGSLPDVVKMVGLFVAAGPMVQVRGRDQHPQLMSDFDTSVVYRGPLIVLVNGASASASEIFAAAIQDYRRGIIMGSQTYGKGTVQQVFNLDDYVNSQYKDLTPLGSVKITTSKFYRISGGTTQRDGVTPDIPVPDPYQYVYEKEKDEDYPINSDRINKAPYNTWNNPPDIQKLQQDFEQRTENDSVFQLMREEAVQFKKQRDNTLVSLNLDEYRKQQKELTDKDKKYDAINKPIPGAVVYAPDGKTLAPKYNEGKSNTPAMVAGNNTIGIYPIGQEAQQMKADTNEVSIENARLRLLTKDVGFFQALQVINEMR
jgi:carboxyl-terminal processing protease